MKIGFPLEKSGESSVKVKMYTEIAVTEKVPKHRRIHKLDRKVNKRIQGH